MKCVWYKYLTYFNQSWSVSTDWINQVQANHKRSCWKNIQIVLLSIKSFFKWPRKCVQMFHVSVCSLNADFKHSTADFSSGRWWFSRNSLSLRKSGSESIPTKPQEDALREYITLFDNSIFRMLSSDSLSCAGTDWPFTKRCFKKVTAQRK